jgi:subtilisin family serine protease
VIRSALASLLLAVPLFAGVVDRDVEREVREHGSARVVVLMRGRSMPALAHDDFTLVARWRQTTAFAAVVRESAIAKLENDPNVVRADLDSAGTGGLLQSLPIIGANTVQAMGFTGKGVTVAILDSGIDATHPDLAGRVVDQSCFCANGSTGCCPNGDTTQFGSGAAADDHGHGTNVSGIVGSKGTVAPVGVAPGVKFVAVKVLDRTNSFSSTAQVLSGMQWVYDNHPEVRVINMSLGTNARFTGYCDTAAAFATAFAQLVDAFRARGTLVFVSAGNNGSTNSIQVPGCIQNVTSVGATYDANFPSVSFTGICTDAPAAVDQITCFTNSNVTLDLLAPGAIITSTGRGGGTSSFLGTSQASPHCAGAAAILMEVQPLLTPDEIESILKATGKPIFDARNGTITPRIDLLAAVQSVQRAKPRRRGVSH